MAGAIIIASAIGILLLVLVGYVLVGSSLASADSIASAQKDMTLLQEERLGTAIDITHAHYQSSTSFEFQIKNTGNQIINYTTLNVIVTWGTNAPVFYNYRDGYSGTWHRIGINPDTIHPTYVDPGEVLDGRIYDIGGTKPNEFGVVTPEGIIDTTTVII